MQSPIWGSGKFRKVTTEILPHTPTPPDYQYNARSPSLNERTHILGDTHSYFFEADRSFARI